MKKVIATVLILLCIACFLSVFVGCKPTENPNESKKVLYPHSVGYVHSEDADDGYATLYIPDDGKCNVLLLADPQLDVTEKYKVVGSENRLTLLLVEKLIDATNPDLVIIAGDIAMTGYLTNADLFCDIADVVESKNIPWSFTFGNHDSENGFYKETATPESAFGQLTKPNLIELVQEKYEHCLVNSSDCESGYGNHFINVRNTKGELLTSICNFDCVYEGESDYSHVIDEKQTEWYAKNIRFLTEQNNGKFSSIAVTHVALPEMFIGWNEAFDDGTPNESYHYGNLLDGDYSSYAPDSEFFATMQSLGSTKAVFFGHHHSNDASIRYKGIDLTFIQHSGMSHEYRTTHKGTYGVMSGWPKNAVFDFTQIDTYGDYRGGTMVTVDSNGDFSYAPVYAKDVISDYKNWTIDYDKVANSIIAERGESAVIRTNK